MKMNKGLRKAWLLVAVLLLALFAIQQLQAADSFEYPLQPQELAKDTYLFEGLTEDFSRRNGGFIVNTGFIVTDEGVIVIDSGPSRRFGEQQRAAIGKVTDKPVLRVYLTHHHPDHVFGNQAYADVPVYALPATNQGIKTEGGMFSDNMYRMVGDWMRGTEVSPATQVAVAGRAMVGGHDLELIALQGHTPGDLVIFDHTTGVLFAGDLVFNRRAATTPHADVNAWFESLQTIQNLPFKVLVPGHGPATHDQGAILQTHDYLQWLVDTLRTGAQNGMDMAEVMQAPIPEQFQGLGVVKAEMQRSVTHLFPKMEQAVLKPVTGEQ